MSIIEEIFFETPDGKICTNCKEYKLLKEFDKNVDCKFGRLNQCKVCRKEKRKAYTKNNQEKIKNYKKQYRINNKEKISEYWASYSEKNKEIIKQYRIDNKDKINQRGAKRRAILGQAAVSWADENKIRLFYEEAKRLEGLDGIPRNVDHIIPLQHPNVCGLHNEFNLQVLTAEENQKKHNKFNEG
jgi:hypothetical protein